MAADEDGETKTVAIVVKPTDTEFLVDNVFTVAKRSPAGQTVVRGRLKYVNDRIGKDGNQVTYEIVNEGDGPNQVPAGAFEVVTVGIAPLAASRFEVRVKSKSKIDFTRNDYTIRLRAKFRSADMIRQQNLMNPPKKVFQTLGERVLTVPINGDLDHILPTNRRNGNIQVASELKITPAMLAAAGAQTPDQIATVVDDMIKARLARVFDASNTGNSGQHIAGARTHIHLAGSPPSVSPNTITANTEGKAGIAVAWNVKATRTTDGQSYDFSKIEILVVPWYVVISNTKDKGTVRHYYTSNKWVSVDGPIDTRAHERFHLYGFNVAKAFEDKVKKKTKNFYRIPFAKRKIGMVPAAHKALRAIQRELATAVPNANDTTDAEATARAMNIVDQNLTGFIPSLVAEGTWHTAVLPDTDFYIFNDTVDDPMVPWNRE